MAKEYSQLDLTDVRCNIKDILSMCINMCITDMHSTDITCTPMEPVPSPTMRPFSCCVTILLKFICLPIYYKLFSIMNSLTMSDL